MITTLIFDLDNTLCECSKYYYDAQQKFTEFASERTKLPPEVCSNLLKAIDLESIKLPQGFSRHRFPRSFAATSVALDVLAENEPDEKSAEQSWMLGNEVFNAPYPLYAGAYETLQLFKQRGLRLFLWTKGDYDVQRRKIVINDLEKMFEATYITLVKDVSLLEKILTDNGIKKDSVLVIGDSARDDIAPANKLGLQSALITSSSLVGTWAYENTQEKPTFEVATVADLPKLQVTYKGEK